MKSSRRLFVLAVLGALLLSLGACVYSHHHWRGHGRHWSHAPHHGWHHGH